MYQATIESFVKSAQAKLGHANSSPAGFFVASMLAGAYVGFGILLIFVLGSSAPPEWRKLVMGLSFGIALTLVVIAGAELFTGHTMFMALRRYSGQGSYGDIAKTWTITWVGNLAGSVLLAALFALGGGSGILDKPDGFLMTVAAGKMSAPWFVLLARAILCNWLVCLALWMSARVQSEAAKCIVIFWCLFAFIACGFEHSIANMTVLAIAMFGNHPETVSIAGFAYNMLWVTLGNIIGGAVFVAGSYFVATHGFVPEVPAVSDNTYDIGARVRAASGDSVVR
jgi:nitrite transporter NirC